MQHHTTAKNPSTLGAFTPAFSITKNKNGQRFGSVISEWDKAKTGQPHLRQFTC